MFSKSLYKCIICIFTAQQSVQQSRSTLIKEYIDFWLDNIHCYSLNDEDDLPNPPVILIGTGMDKIKNEEERCQKTKSLNSFLDGHRKRRHIRDLCFLSNEEPSKYKTEFEYLRKVIFKLAGDIPKWGDNLPTRWIVLEKEIDRLIDDGKRVIPHKEAELLAKICSFPISEMESELNSFLKYEHETGNLIYFDDIKSYIVLKPEWLVDIFKCFVSPFEFQRYFVGLPDWSQLESTGVLPDTLIKKLFKKVPGFDSAKHTQFALEIMEKFDIIVKPKEGNDEYYMPCMINASGFEIITKTFNVPSKNCSRTAWFCLDFNFLPPSFFNHLLVTFVKKYVLCTDKNDRLQLYRGMGIFNFEESGCQKLIVCLSENSIAVQVWNFHNEEQQICNTNYGNIREYILSTVQLLQRRYKIRIQYECFLKCPEGIYFKRLEKYLVINHMANITALITGLPTRWKNYVRDGLR
ncbi:unnamed protein product [Mytilus edulis]|uniref:COR domain-containing protein n=1 Tax=Mytilus edulis TaxID=6550 RepID=A0A8S3SYS2_MYTED|nr:unnamed protein product [Mytilus edulis]